MFLELSDTFLYNELNINLNICVLICIIFATSSIFLQHLKKGENIFPRTDFYSGVFLVLRLSWITCTCAANVTAFLEAAR